MGSATSVVVCGGAVHRPFKLAAWMLPPVGIRHPLRCCIKAWGISFAPGNLQARKKKKLDRLAHIPGVLLFYTPGRTGGAFAYYVVFPVMLELLRRHHIPPRRGR